MSSEKFKSIFSKFEDDKFLDAKEELAQHFRQKTNEYLKKELDLKDDPISGVEGVEDDG